MSGGAGRLPNPHRFMAYQPFRPDRPRDRRLATKRRRRRVMAGRRPFIPGRSQPTLPSASAIPWRSWGVSHGFVATAADQGTLLRVHACYTPPAPTGRCPASPQRDLAHQRAAAKRAARRSSMLRVPCSSAPARPPASRRRPPAFPPPRCSGRRAPPIRPAPGAMSPPVPVRPPLTTPPVHDARRQRRPVPHRSPPMRWERRRAPAVTVSVSDLDVAPTIATQPASLSVTSGSDAVFAVDARGTEALSYQWYRNGVALAGANSPVLRLTGVTNANAGSYTVDGQQQRRMRTAMRPPLTRVGGHTRRGRAIDRHAARQPSPRTSAAPQRLRSVSMAPDRSRSSGAAMA